MGKKGQASFEYLTILGVILVLLIPFVFYVTSQVNREVKFNTAQEAVSKLAAAADSVAVLGPGTKRFVTISLPSGITAVSINGTEVLVKLSYKGLDSDINARTKATVSGNLKKDKGTYRISVEVLNEGTVYIGSFNDTNPPQILWTSPSGTIDYFDIILKATTDENANCRHATSDMLYSSMSSSFNGSLLAHEANLGTFANGTYTYYARCQDTAGNTMTSSAIINFTIVINTSLAAELPQVLLESPPNNSLRNFNYINFTYNASSPSYNISSCTLHVDSVDLTSILTVTDNSIIENLSQSLPASIGKGNFTWHVNCTDTSPSARSGTSELRTLQINTSGNEAFLNSCPGNCGFAGYADGACRQNEAQCNNNGEVHLAQYDYQCTGGTQADTCCCRP